MFVLNYEQCSVYVSGNFYRAPGPGCKFLEYRLRNCGVGLRFQLSYEGWPLAVHSYSSLRLHAM
jgi:hypothetical protein